MTAYPFKSSFGWVDVMSGSSAKTLLAASVFVLSAGAAHAALLLNGDFEAGPFLSGDSYVTYNSPGGLYGWAVTSGSVDLVHQASPSAVKYGAITGSSIDLAGSSAGRIEQTFAATVGNTYTVSFQYSGNGDGGVSSRPFEVQLGGVTQNLSGTYGSIGTGTIFFTPVASGNYTLSFAALTGSSPYGATIDNVSMSAAPVPEPHEWALLLSGLAITGWVARRRRVKAA